MARPALLRVRQAGWALVALPLVLAACSSSPSTSAGSSASSAGSAGSNSSLQHAGTAVLTHLAAYQSTVASCRSAASPVQCLEQADRKLGDQVHSYANVLAIGKGFSAPQSDALAARNDAQTLANSLEILGDAQPTQANYDQVRNNFNVDGAIAQLRGAVQKLDGALGG